MNCPECGKEMRTGVLNSMRTVYFSAKKRSFHSFRFRRKPRAEEGEVAILTYDIFGFSYVPDAWHCPGCKKVVVDYSGIT